MKRVYMAGPYSANNVIDVLRNIGKGEAMAARLFKLGFAPFCPCHDKDFVIKNFNENFNVQQFYDYSISWLKVSEAVYLGEGWKNSKGTLEEIETAKKLGIPIFENIEELIAWRDNGYTLGTV